MVRKRTVVWGLAAVLIAFCLGAGCAKKDEDKGPSGPDETPPRVASVSATSSNTVKVIFNENVEEASAETDTNYVITDLSVYDATLETDMKTVTLVTAAQDSGQGYGMTIKNVKDLAENTMADTTLFFLGYFSIPELSVWAMIGTYREPNVNTAYAHVTRGGSEVDDATVTIGGTQLVYVGSGEYEPPGGTMNLTPGQSYGLSITTPQQDSVTGSVEMVYPVTITGPLQGQVFLIGQSIPVSWSYQGGHTPDEGILMLGHENWYYYEFPGSAVIEPDPSAQILVAAVKNGTITGSGSFYFAGDLEIVDIVIH